MIDWLEIKMSFLSKVKNNSRGEKRGGPYTEG
jgi:hypothetical protein